MASPRSVRSRAARGSPKKNSMRTATWSAPSILVASTLVINAFDGCQAAPRPVPTADIYQQRRSQKARARAFADVDDSIPSWERREQGAHEVDMNARDKHTWSTSFAKRDIIASSSPTHTRPFYAISTDSSNHVVVPSAFASNIASSWDPGHRSIWFQRKAVIITSVFLAILIVLIIGAAAFVRDKREADAEGEVDVSDEAALKRMKEERDMRNGGKKGRGKKEVSGDDGVSIKSGKKGAATGIALRWAKVPVRRLRNRKGRISSSLTSSSKESITNEEDSPSPSPLEQSANVASISASEETGSIGAQAAQGSEEGPSESVLISVDSQAPPSSSRDPLSVADVSAADAELERHLHGGLPEEEVDAFPPAYISRTREELHPSANRQLVAGSSRIADLASTSEEKQPIQSTGTADADQADAPPSLPTIAEMSSVADGQDHYSGHVATDDKTLLGQLHHAASAPSAPSGQGRATSGMEISTDSSSASLQTPSQASAPVLDVTAAPDDDLTEEEIRSIQASGKGKASFTLLPAPPRPLSSSSFSRFDMPYAMDHVAPAVSPPALHRTKSKLLSEKEQEAEEERCKTLALVESKPQDMVHLPKYESAQQDIPSALEELDETPEQSLPSAPPTPSAPSAPPAEN